MFYRYEIKNNGIEDILYLYLDMRNEFSKEIGYSNDDNEISRRTKNFVKNNTNFKGNKVYLVIDNIVVKSVDINNKDIEIEVLQKDLYYSNDKYLCKIVMTDSSIIEISLRDYLLGILASNFDNSLELETLKSLCVLIRGYAYMEMAEKRCINTINEFFSYKPISYYKLSWLNDYDTIINKLNLAIDSTDCLFITCNNNYILPFYHYCNYGKTVSSNKYLYLNSVASLWDLASPYYINIKDISYTDISKILGININNNSNIELLDVDSDYLIEKILIDKSTFLGDKFIKLLDLSSRNINIIMNKESIKFICRGFGEFLGLSIYGSNELAKNGYDYTNILMYYFKNIRINKYVKELPN